MTATMGKHGVEVLPVDALPELVNTTSHVSVLAK